MPARIGWQLSEARVPAIVADVVALVILAPPLAFGPNPRTRALGVDGLAVYG
jgi:hypothetical protein